jgi:hypothetical protein
MLISNESRDRDRIIMTDSEMIEEKIGEVLGLESSGTTCFKWIIR